MPDQAEGLRELRDSMVGVSSQRTLSAMDRHTELVEGPAKYAPDIARGFMENTGEGTLVSEETIKAFLVCLKNENKVKELFSEPSFLAQMKERGLEWTERPWEPETPADYTSKLGRKHGSINVHFDGGLTMFHNFTSLDDLETLFDRVRKEFTR